MVDNHDHAGISIAADVLIAPHHGADNGSSRCFIQAVDPDFVIFSAGHQYRHPRDATAQRYLNAPVSIPPANIFRTDRGDDETEADHWEPTGTISGCSDGRGDDDVMIVLRDNGSVSVAYREASTGC